MVQLILTPTKSPDFYPRSSLTLSRRTGPRSRIPTRKPELGYQHIWKRMRWQSTTGWRSTLSSYDSYDIEIHCQAIHRQNLCFFSSNFFFVKVLQILTKRDNAGFEITDSALLQTCCSKNTKQRYLNFTCFKNKSRFDRACFFPFLFSAVWFPSRSDGKKFSGIFLVLLFSFSPLFEKGKA